MHWNTRFFRKRRSPHGAKVPASYGCIIRCGELAAVVVGAPFARGELQLTFALQGGSAGDLQRRATPSLPSLSRDVNFIQISVTGSASTVHSISIIRHYWKSFSLQATLKTTIVRYDSVVIFWALLAHQLPAELCHAETCALLLT